MGDMGKRKANRNHPGIILRCRDRTCCRRRAHIFDICAVYVQSQYSLPYDSVNVLTFRLYDTVSPHPGRATPGYVSLPSQSLGLKWILD